MLGEPDPSYDREKLDCPDDSGLEHCDVCEQDVPDCIGVRYIGDDTVCEVCEEEREKCSQCGVWHYKDEVYGDEGKRVCTDCVGAEQEEA